MKLKIEETVRPIRDLIPEDVHQLIAEVRFHFQSNGPSVVIKFGNQCSVSIVTKEMAETAELVETDWEDPQTLFHLMIFDRAGREIPCMGYLTAEEVRDLLSEYSALPMETAKAV